MNRLAISYAFNCSHVRNGVELIDTYALAFLLAIAYRIPSRSRYETEPTTLAEFEGMTKMSNRKLRERRELLVKLGEIREGGHEAPDHADPANERPWAKHAIYQLTGLAGPLFVVTPWDVDLTAAQLASVRAQKSARRAAFGGQNAAQRAAFDSESRHSVPRSDHKTRHSVPRQVGTACRVSGIRAGGVLSSSTSEGTNNYDDADLPPIVSASTQIVAEDLFAWVVAEYPHHNGDAVISVSKSRALRILGNLISTGRTVDKIKAMVLKLWTCTERDRGCRWIASTDRSLFVLWEARDTLDQLVSNAQARRHGAAPAHAPHDASSSRETALRRAIGVLRRPHHVQALNDVRQRAADALEAGDANVAGIDQELFAAAAAHVDVAAVQREADAELSKFKPRMPADQFDRAVVACKLRLTREWAMLPNLSELMSQSEGALA